MSLRLLSLHALLFGSGAAGLVYEVCWSRQLGLHVGLGERGAALTLAIFFAGMAAGYALAAGLSRRVQVNLRAYAICEAMVALCALVLPALTAGSGEYATAVLVFLSFAASVAMGASLPFVLAELADASASVARAYALHLAGATLGCLTTTFMLIEKLGVWGSTRAAAGVSAGCALLAFALQRKHANVVPAEQAPYLRFLLAAALAGACTLALQVLTIRLLALTFHNSSYTFGLTISVFIVYLALGSRSAARSLKRPREALFSTALVAALGTLLMLPVFAQVTRFGVLRAPTFASYVLLSLGLVAAVLALPVLFAGRLLPLLWASAGGRAGETVGALTGANSVGGALGALGTSFVLLPHLGLRVSLVVVADILLVLGLSVSRITRRKLLMSVSLVPCAWLVLDAAPPPRPGEQNLAHFETAHGLLDVVRSEKPASMSARLDLHYRLGASVDRPRHLSMGRLPLALHARPERVLFVGLATGMTASAVVDDSRVKHAEIVELIPEMAAVARVFGAVNQHVLDDPRVHLTIADGRAFMARASEFDLIVSDLFVPWHSHAGYLYTIEHYRHVRARLARGGLFVQWLPMWQLGPAEFELIANSFASVFSRACVWLDDRDPEHTLLGLASDDRAPGGQLPVGLRSPGRFHALPGAQLNTDEMPRLEFSAPRSERSGQLLTGERLRDFLRRRFPGSGAASGNEPRVP